MMTVEQIQRSFNEMECSFERGGGGIGIRAEAVPKTHYEEIHDELLKVQAEPQGWDLTKRWKHMKLEKDLRYKLEHHEELFPEEYV